MISEPLPSLKEIQEWILKNILYKGEVSPYARECFTVCTFFQIFVTVVL